MKPSGISGCTSRQRQLASSPLPCGCWASRCQTVCKTYLSVMDNVINVGLIGFSVAGQVFHAPVITSVDGLRLHRVTARRPEQQEVLGHRYPGAVPMESAAELIQADDIALVVVASSNDV